MAKSWQTDLTEMINKFRDQRNWRQYHTPKNLAINLSVEASEVLENFLWKSDDEVDHKALKGELADVQYSILLLADEYGIDLYDSVVDKLGVNAVKYPVDRFKGSNKKYNQ